jgi:hypothetical protein
MIRSCVVAALLHRKGLQTLSADISHSYRFTKDKTLSPKGLAKFVLQGNGTYMKNFGEFSPRPKPWGASIFR